MKFEKLLRGINFKKVIEGFNDANLNKREVVLCVDFGFVFILLYKIYVLNLTYIIPFGRDNYMYIVHYTVI